MGNCLPLIRESQPRIQSQQRLLLLATEMKLKRCFAIHHQLCQFSTLNSWKLKPFSAAFPVIGFQFWAQGRELC